jgi:hypothetical protein
LIVALRASRGATIFISAAGSCGHINRQGIGRTSDRGSENAATGCLTGIERRRNSKDKIFRERSHSAAHRSPHHLPPHLPQSHYYHSAYKSIDFAPQRRVRHRDPADYEL